MAITILRLPIVKTRTGLSRSTIYLRVSKKSFPEPVSLGGRSFWLIRPASSSRAVGWIEDEIEAWLKAQIDASRSTSA